MPINTENRPESQNGKHNDSNGTGAARIIKRPSEPLRTERYRPARTVRISVTRARTHLFELFDLIARHDLTAIILHRGKARAQIIYDGPADDPHVSLISPGLLQALTGTSRSRRNKNRAPSRRKVMEATSR